MTDLKRTCLFECHVEQHHRLPRPAGPTAQQPFKVRQKVIDLRRNFLQMQYCFS